MNGFSSAVNAESPKSFTNNHFADKAGNPYLKDGMVSRISCKVVDQLDIGNFVDFLYFYSYNVINFILYGG